MTATHEGIRWTDEDVVNADAFMPQGHYNPHRVRPWLLHDHGFVLAVVFADCLQDAIDIAVDADKLDRYMVTAADLDGYMDDSGQEHGITYLGNAGEPFDIDTLGVVELPNPPFSFAALFT